MSKPAWSSGARQGPLRRHKQLVFFACEGLVALLDEREKAVLANDVYNVMTPQSFKERAEALIGVARKIKAGDKKWQKQEGAEMRQAANDMLETAKEATDMGDPSDPAVQAFWERHRTHRVVKFCGFELGAPLRTVQQMAKAAPTTGRQTAPPIDQAGLESMQHQARTIYQAPRRKNRVSKLILDL